MNDFDVVELFLGSREFEWGIIFKTDQCLQGGTLILVTAIPGSSLTFLISILDNIRFPQKSRLTLLQ